jgi:hypothetical protein
MAKLIRTNNIAGNMSLGSRKFFVIFCLMMSHVLAIKFEPLALQTQQLIPLVKAHAPLYYVVTVPSNGSFTGLSISILCPSACTSNTELNISTDATVIADGHFTWQYLGITSFPGVLINPFSNPPFVAGAYYIAYTSDTDLEGIQIMAQGYSDGSENWKIGHDEKVIVKPVQMNADEHHDLSLFVPIAIPSGIKDSTNDEKLQKRYQELLSSLSSSEVDSPSPSQHSEFEALFNTYYKAAKVSSSDHLRYCHANRHVVYVAPRTDEQPVRDYKHIKNSFAAITRSSVDACIHLEKKVLPFATLRTDINNLLRLGIKPNVEYIMYLMAFGKNDEKPLLLSGPYYSVLILSRKWNQIYQLQGRLS